MEIIKTSTLQELIDIGSTVEMTYYKSSYLEVINNIEYSVHNIINDYMEELNQYLVTVTLTDTEYRKYCYKPKLLAYDLYGSTDLFFILMIFNNICDVKDFNMRKVKVLSPSNISLINNIFIAEKAYLEQNRYEIANGIVPTQVVQKNNLSNITHVESFNIYAGKSLESTLNGNTMTTLSLYTTNVREFSISVLSGVDQYIYILYPASLGKCAITATGAAVFTLLGKIGININNTFEFFSIYRSDLSNLGAVDIDIN